MKTLNLSHMPLLTPNYDQVCSKLYTVRRIQFYTLSYLTQLLFLRICELFTAHQKRTRNAKLAGTKPRPILSRLTLGVE